MIARLIRGDCRDLLAHAPPNSIDAIVTDAPYELGFMERRWDATGVATDPATWAAALRVAKPGAHMLVFGGTRKFHRVACAIEDAGWDLRDTILSGHEAISILGDCPWLMGWLYGQGYPKSRKFEGQWQGWGTGLKPAWEPIIIARKPFPGTIYENVEAHGVGALNIDACRIPGVKDVPGSVGTRNRADLGVGWGVRAKADTDGRNPDVPRWPANVIHDGSLSVLQTFPAAPGQKAALSGKGGARKTQHVYNPMQRAHRDGEPSANRENGGAVGFRMRPGERRADSGSAARFFYCAKATTRDRNEGLGQAQGGLFGGTQGPDANRHPTVKPTELLRYLVRLITPPGGIVLDLFAGSGSTGKAAALEGFDFIGLELDQDEHGEPAGHIEVARGRIAHAGAQVEVLDGRERGAACWEGWPWGATERSEPGVGRSAAPGSR